MPTAAGGDATGTGGSASFSLGQTFYTAVDDGSTSVWAGVQQPYEISIISGVEGHAGISLDLSVYPNPSVNILTLSIGGYNNEEMFFHLYDIKGRLLQQARIVNDKTTINVEERPAAAYLLRVSDNTTDLKTFKIIKHLP